MVILSYQNPLQNHIFNKYSQNGEDGIISEILKRLGNKINNWNICEFGAWDGIFLSNTFKLLQDDANIKALYIEGDKDRYSDLLLTCSKYTNIIPHCGYVSYQNNDDSLDNILKKHNFPVDFLLLSIDIDSWDYQVFKSLEIFRPIIIIIEINSSISPLNEEYIHDGVNMAGTSFMPMYILGIQKGYNLVCHTGNMIFVRNDYYSYLSLPENTIENVLNIFNPVWLKANNYSEYKMLYL